MENIKDAAICSKWLLLQLLPQNLWLFGGSQTWPLGPRKRPLKTWYSTVRLVTPKNERFTLFLTINDHVYICLWSNFSKKSDLHPKKWPSLRGSAAVPIAAAARLAVPATWRKPEAKRNKAALFLAVAHLDDLYTTLQYLTYISIFHDFGEALEPQRMKALLGTPVAKKSSGPENQNMAWARVELVVQLESKGLVGAAPDIGLIMGENVCFRLFSGHSGPKTNGELWRAPILSYS